MTVQRRRAIAIKIHCPILPETLAAILAGDANAIEQDPASAAILKVIRADNPLGDFTDYSGVCEISVGWESFQPGPDASPTLGSPGKRSLSPTAILRTYASADADIELALAELLAVHPWEVPVIEISEVGLIVRQLPSP